MQSHAARRPNPRSAGSTPCWPLPRAAWLGRRRQTVCLVALNGGRALLATRADLPERRIGAAMELSKRHGAATPCQGVAQSDVAALPNRQAVACSTDAPSPARPQTTRFSPTGISRRQCAGSHASLDRSRTALVLSTPPAATRLPLAIAPLLPPAPRSPTVVPTPSPSPRLSRRPLPHDRHSVP